MLSKIAKRFYMASTPLSVSRDIRNSKWTHQITDQ